MKKAQGFFSGEIPLFIFICGVYFFSYFQRVAVPGTIFNQLQTEFVVSATSVAALSAIYLYIYGGMQFFAGLLTDSFGAGRIILAGGIVLAAGSLLFPLAGDVFSLYGARVLVGLGASLIYISLLKETDRIFGARRFPFFLSLAVTVGFTGGLVGTFPFERMVAWAGWRPALLVFGVLCAICVLCAGVLLGRRGELALPRRAKSRRRPPGILRHRAARLIVFSGPVNFSVYFLLQATIGKKMLEDFAGLSSPEASGVTFIMMLLTQLSIIGQGVLSRRFRARRPFIVLSARGCFIAVLLINLALFLNLPAGWFRAAYFLAALSAVNLMSITAIKEMSPQEGAAGAVGIYNGITYLAVAILSNLAGAVMDFFSGQAREIPGALVYPAAAYQWIFLSCFFFSLLSVISAARLEERELAP